MFALVSVMCIIMMTMILFPFSLFVCAIFLLYLFLCSFFCVSLSLAFLLSLSLSLWLSFIGKYRNVYSLFSFLFVHAIVFARIFHLGSSWRSKFSNVSAYECMVHVSVCAISRTDMVVKNVACPHGLVELMSLCIRT